MADNTPTTSGDLIATDDLTQLNGGAVSGVKAQRVKIGWGLDGQLWDINPATGFGAPVQGETNGGSAAGGHRPVLAGGIDSGTIVRTLRVATDGSLLINGVQDSRTTGNIVASTTVVGPVSVANRNVVTFSISGTHAGVSFVIEATDDGTTWFGLQSINNTTGVASAAWTPGTNAIASYDAAVGGYTQVRVRATAYTSGSAVIGINPQVFAYDPVVAAISQGPAAAGTAALGNPVLTGGTDGTNARIMSVDTSGRPVVVLAPSTSFAVIQSTANTAATLTIAAAGAGLFVYLTSVQLRRANTSATAVAAAASNLTYTSTNIPGSFAVHAGNAIAGGTTIIDYDRSFTQPLKTTTANTATTIVAPAAGAGVQTEIIVTYYTAP